MSHKITCSMWQQQWRTLAGEMLTVDVVVYHTYVDFITSWVKSSSCPLLLLDTLQFVMCYDLTKELESLIWHHIQGFNNIKPVMKISIDLYFTKEEIFAWTAQYKGFFSISPASVTSSYLIPW